MATMDEHAGQPVAVQPTEVGAARLARGALSLFDTISSTLANLAPVEGIFLSVTLVVFAMGAQAPWAFLIAGIAILATGNTMSEFSKSIPSAGSFVTFIGRGVGARAPRSGSVLAGISYYLLVICYPVTIGAVVVFMGSWVSSLFGWGNAGWLAVTLAGVALAVPLLLRGVVISARASFIMFCSEALGLIILSVVVLSRVHGHLGAPFHADGGAPGGFRGLVGLTFALAVSGFVGWENSGALAEESRNPRRYIPITVFTCIAIIAVLYVLSTWAAVAGFADWKGTIAGVNFLGSPAEATPFLDLSRHFSSWFDWFIGIVGFTSSFGCFIAAANSQTRITFNGARAGLLPPSMATVTRTKVPWASVAIYTGLTVLLVVIPFFALHGNAVSIFSDEAGIGTVPILIVYLLANIALPLHVLATDRASFRPIRHVAVPLIGTAVLLYGVWEFVQPSQPPPANVYWAWILGIVLIAVAATTIAYFRARAALDRAASAGPELVLAADTPPADLTRVACCQIAPRIGAPKANRAAGLAAAQAAATSGAVIVVLPELSASGYVFRDVAEARSLAEPADGPTAAGWAVLARRHDITIVGGVCELGADGLLYNTAVAVDAGGVRVAYRKAHLWDAEKLVFTPGEDPPPVIETAGTSLALMICYDLEFPEWVRLPALAGARLLCVPANWPALPRPEGERPIEVVRAQAAASTNRMFVAVCDRTGAERGVDWVGGSVIIDPDGWPLAGTDRGDHEITIAADCDLGSAADKRVSERNDVLTDRRPALYGGVTRRDPDD